ncbi:hypothetical protein KKG81_12185 [bacterium]|mgnify:CR=1 FL=1|nr:hypothetical protein [bacterium]
MISTDEIINISKFFSIIAHTPGRLRVRVNPKIKDSSGNISLSDIENLPSKIDGIMNIKINKIIASVTITYDPKIFEPKIWEDLISQENLDEISILINNLAKEVI